MVMIGKVRDIGTVRMVTNFSRKTKMKDSFVQCCRSGSILNSRYKFTIQRLTDYKFI